MRSRPPFLALLAAAVLMIPVTASARREPPPAPAPTDTLHLTLDDAIQRALSRSEEMRAAHAFVS